MLYKNNINAILNNDKGINLGSVYETVCAMELVAHGHDLFYFDSKKVDPAIWWLKEYGLIEYCYNLTRLELPLEGNKIDNIFKLYLTDTGLFVSMLDDNALRDIMFGNMWIYKGVIYENIVADALIKNKIPLYYFAKDS